MRAAFVATLALLVVSGSGCRRASTAGPVGPEGVEERSRPDAVGPHEGDTVNELEARLRRLTGEQETLIPASSEDPAKCEDVCSLATSICGVKEKLCNLAEDHPGDADYQGLCREAKQECREAQDACVACVERNRSSQPAE